MFSDDDFEPRLGRMPAKGGKQGRKFLSKVLAAANLARGGTGISGRRSRFDGSRIGRGSGVGRILGSRDRYAAFRSRRVIIKSRIVKLAGKGSAAARAHMRYIERDGTTRDGGRGQLYGADADKVDGKAWLDKAQGDRHQFRFIVSPEDGAEYDDLKDLTRRLMARMEEDLGTKLDWVAVDLSEARVDALHDRSAEPLFDGLLVDRIMGHLRPRMVQNCLNLDFAPQSSEPGVLGQFCAVRLQANDIVVRNEQRVGIITVAGGVMDLGPIVVDVEILMKEPRLGKRFNVRVSVEDQPAAGQVLDLVGDVRAVAHLSIFNLSAE